MCGRLHNTSPCFCMQFKAHTLFLFLFYVFMLILCLYLTFEKEKKINNGKRKLAPTDSCKFFLKSFDQEEEILP